jgi:hypothetical protein
MNTSTSPNQSPELTEQQRRGRRLLDQDCCQHTLLRSGTSGIVMMALAVLAQLFMAQQATQGSESANEDFPAMLNELQKEPDPVKRGFDGDQPSNTEHIGNRVVKLIGRPDCYDPFGTKDLRDAVIERWRKRYAAGGAASLEGNKPHNLLNGRQKAKLGEISLAGKFKSNTPFFLNNSRLYELGAMDGAFPPMGRLLGDQSGIWTPPVKALDGFALTVREDGLPAWPLADCVDFSHDFCSARFRFVRDPLQIERCDFPAADEPALFVQLTLLNRSDQRRKLILDFTGRVNVRPGWRTRWQNNRKNGPDQIRASGTLFFAADPNIENSGVFFGSDRKPVASSIVDNEATLSYPVEIPANGSSTVLFLVYGKIEADTPEARQRFGELAGRAVEELNKSEKHLQENVFGGVRFSCSDQEVADSYYLAKANLLLLTGDHRPYQPDKFLYAGLPVYTQLFANDTSQSLPGVLGAGMWDLAAGTLECLTQAGKKHAGLVPHETALDASHVGDSNAQETPQFIAACWQYYIWTRDVEFLRRVYPFAKYCLTAAQQRFDPGNSGYFSGPALIESSGMGPRKVDAACHLYAARVSLAEMATTLGQSDESREFRAQAEAFKTRFNKDWWIANDKIWADSMNADGTQPWKGYWSVVFPMLSGIAAADKGMLALGRIEHEWVNQWGGVHTLEPDISRQGSGVVTTELFGVAGFGYGNADFGWRMVKLASLAARQDRLRGAFTECVPPGGSDFIQLWSVGPFLQCLVAGLAGVHPQPPPHSVDLWPQLPRDLDWFKLEDCRIAKHVLTLEHRKTGKTSTTTITHSKGDAALSGTFWLPADARAAVTINGKAVEPVKQRIPLTEIELAGVKYELPPGHKLIIVVEK